MHHLAGFQHDHCSYRTVFDPRLHLGRKGRLWPFGQGRDRPFAARQGAGEEQLIHVAEVLYDGIGLKQAVHRQKPPDLFALPQGSGGKDQGQNGKHLQQAAQKAGHGGSFRFAAGDHAAGPLASWKCG